MATKPHQHGNPDQGMGLPLPNGKLSMWLFIVTEIMFFTALIGTYLILRGGIPVDSKGILHWPTPHQVHLSEFTGALNTLILLASSLTVVLAQWFASRNEQAKTNGFIAATIFLGCVFLGIKTIEYREKFRHDILPGRMGELLPGMTIQRQNSFHNVGIQYVERVRSQLEDHIVSAGKTIAPEMKTITDITPEIIANCPDVTKVAFNILQRMTGKMGKDKEGNPTYQTPLSPAEVGFEVNQLLKESSGKIHLSPAIPFGNIWSSCYFTMTGLHAIHVLIGILVFLVFLCRSFFGSVGSGLANNLEVAGLYWHFVDIVWIILFPLLYLI
ncbi:MAG: heme-copper oxidase subunit III [Gemmataceae bacterium]